MNWKKIWFGILVIGIPLTMLAASIKWYNDAGIPQKTALTGTEILSFMETTPNRYGWAYARDAIKAGTSTNITTNYVVYGPNYYTNNTTVNEYFTTNILLNTTVSNYFAEFQYITNVYQTNVTIEQYLTQNSYVSNYTMTNIFANSFVSNYFVTNLFPTTYVYTTNVIGGDFIANQGGRGTNTSLYGDTSFIGDGAGAATFYDASGVVPLAGFNGTWFWGNGGGLTNLPQNAITVISNTTINTKQLTVLSNFYFLSATPQDVAWAGPTNTGDFRLGSRQSYVTYTPVALTNLIGDTNGYINSLMLTLSNGASTNIQFWAPTNLVKLADGESNPYTVSNGTRFKWWAEKSGQGYDAVSRRWGP